MRMIVPIVAGAAGLVAAITGAHPATAQQASRNAVLPPELPWSGKSRSLAVAPTHPWATPAEQSGFRTTPRYDATVAWPRRLDTASPNVSMVSLGRSPEGRDIWMVVVSREAASTPEALHAPGRPVLFAQAGIHAGEIDGKDAGMMLLRDLTVGGAKRALLEQASFLFVPIFSVDGHERFSRFGRINQRGPEETGWRTTAQNLNLNRDYAKADAPEMQAVVKALGLWNPDLVLDLHVSDGMDFQYDITWSFNDTQAWSPAISGWLKQTLVGAWTRDLEAMGHVPGPFLWLREDADPAKGVVDATGSVRYSEGYGDARHLPTVLIENHSLKPYAQRVFGTYVLLESTLTTLGRAGRALRDAAEQDRKRRPAEVTLDWKPPEVTDQVTIKGVEHRIRSSTVSGAKWVEWTGKPADVTVPLLRQTMAKTIVRRPAAYWVPAAATEVIERLALHGVRMERMDAPREVAVEMYRLSEVRLDQEPFEGRVRVSAKVSTEQRKQRYAVGSVRVPTDQPLGTLAMLLLEPESPDSFFQWGFFLDCLQQTEYAEAYIIEPMAERMLTENASLRAEFEKAMREDPELAKSPQKRRDFFYARTPFFDDRWRLYPVGRER
jgi:murein tripeptide amidase MpaA